MKKIIVSANKSELDELEIVDENISLKELDEKLLIRRIRKNAAQMQLIAQKADGRIMDEEEVFQMVRESAIK
jgi:hypothetical protein